MTLSRAVNTVDAVLRGLAARIEISGYCIYLVTGPFKTVIHLASHMQTLKPKRCILCTKCNG